MDITILGDTMITMIRADIVRVGSTGWEGSRVYLDNEEQPCWTYANAQRGFVERFDTSDLTKHATRLNDVMERIEGDVKIFVPEKMSFCDLLRWQDMRIKRCAKYWRD